MIGVAMVTGVALIAVLEHHFKTVDPGKFVGVCNSFHNTLQQNEDRCINSH